jgi:hypothetical protein
LLRRAFIAPLKKEMFGMTRQPWRGHLVVWLLPTLLAAVFALAGCGAGGIGGASPTATATPSAAGILQHAQSVKITDAAFTLTLSGTASGQDVTGTANGKLTQTPPRDDITFNLTSGGQQIAFETITDGTTNTTYTQFTQPAALATGKWTKASGGASGGLFNASQFTDYSQIKNPTLVGKDTVNGIAVWHLKGQDTAAGETGNVDVFVRQDNYEPVEIKGQATSSGTNINISLIFTSVNSGTISISLPPAN